MNAHILLYGYLLLVPIAIVDAIAIAIAVVLLNSSWV